jgi:hypothetical protein
MRLRGDDSVVAVAVVERDEEAAHENEVELDDLKDIVESEAPEELNEELFSENESPAAEPSPEE